MSINVTTLSASVAVTDTVVNVASATGITAPNYQQGFNPLTGAGAGVTYLLIEQEIMKVVGVASTVISVVRGEFGSIITAHGSSAPVVAGLSSDFPNFVPAVRTAVPQYPVQFQGFSAPVASATSITPT